MPIYEYQCNACGHCVEILQKVSDAPATDCPACNKPDLQKLVSAAGFQLKGTGWYATDFKDKGKTEKKSESQSGTTDSSKIKDDKNPSSTSTTGEKTK